MSTFVISQRRKAQMESLRSALERTLEAEVPRGSPVALLDVPVHTNFGDWIIWLGTEAFLADRGCRVVYRASRREFSAAAMRRRISAETVLVCLGGGNFGDLYPQHQRLREQIVSGFAAHRVVVFPQSLHFEKESQLVRARRVFGEHPRLTLLVRDEASREIAAGITESARLAPDTAHYLYPLSLSPASESGVLHLMRTDKEAVSDRADPAPRKEAAGDWLDLMPAATVGRVAMAALLAPTSRIFGIQDRFHSRWKAAVERTAEATFSSLSEYSEIVTDRLHGLLSALLLDRRVVVFDNSYGKLSGYHRCWLQDVEACTLVSEGSPEC